MDKLNNSSELRYNIKARIESMTKEAQATIKKKVLKDSGMCKSSYYNALTIKHKDSNDISGKMLRAFSKALKVKMEQLFNAADKKNIE